MEEVGRRMLSLDSMAAIPPSTEALAELEQPAPAMPELTAVAQAPAGALLRASRTERNAGARGPALKPAQPPDLPEIDLDRSFLNVQCE